VAVPKIGFFLLRRSTSTSVCVDDRWNTKTKKRPVHIKQQPFIVASAEIPSTNQQHALKDKKGSRK
jgi:hypothetical protein